MKKILFALTCMFLMVSCECPTTQVSQINTTSIHTQATKSDKVAKVIVRYKIRPAGASGKRWVEKWEIDGHEYLVFGSGSAYPPTVIHNQACPCNKLK